MGRQCSSGAMTSMCKCMAGHACHAASCPLARPDNWASGCADSMQRCRVLLCLLPADDVRPLQHAAGSVCFTARANKKCDSEGCTRLTCDYDKDTNKKGCEQQCNQHRAQCDIPVFASFVASIHHRTRHGRQEDETHILDLPHSKWEGTLDTEDYLVDPTAEEHQLHHLSQNWLEEVVLQQCASRRQQACDQTQVKSGQHGGGVLACLVHTPLC